MDTQANKNSSAADAIERAPQDPPIAPPSAPVAATDATAAPVEAQVIAAPVVVQAAPMDPSVPWWKQLSPSWHAIAFVAFLVVCGYLVRELAPVLTPFMFGAILAYVGAPIVAWLERRKVSRTLGAIVVISVFVGFLAAMILVVAPLIAKEFQVITDKMPDIVARIQSEWIPWINERFGLALSLDLSQLKSLAADNKDAVSELGAKLAGSAKFGGQVLITLLINVTLIPVVMFYLLRDWPQLVATIDSLTPKSAQPTVRALAKEIDAVLSEFLRGQGLVMIALATYYCIALKLVGLEFALPVGLVTGLLVFIPYIGFGLGMVLGLLAALTQFSTFGPVLAVAAVFGVGQILEGFVLVPYLVGDRIGLHPLAVIFALMAFGQLFGFVGVLLALPLSAALLVSVRLLRRRFNEHNAASAST